MRSLTLGFALAVTTTAFAHGTWDGDRCNAHNFRFNDRDAYVEEQTIDAGSLRSLKASARNAPIAVEGGSGSGYTIKVCKAAAQHSDLAQIRVAVENGELKAYGPSSSKSEWTVTYKITVPRGGGIDVETTNGPISFHDVDGTIEAHAKNGPLSLKNVSGNVNARTQNGPINVSGSRGTMKVRASNGPLSVSLDGNAWSGNLDASTENGPLTLKIPRNYGSLVSVETNGRGPVSCRADDCPRDSGDGFPWNQEPRKYEFGRGPANVRLSTTNGPVTIKDAE
jgi:DUF4097 and DUF4098 domain-containing protein YvlB